eukprot:NODE_6273_length_520_cov_36.794055_g5505_i0.p2 GENE.NODE_6273_length_520_cov_36.794055_g5505_i0~~NODE_6273_length_520_cov_36.794055_g5505_i0.p2  ORF type:complete len:70 (-),score=4.64 NODE_6273_length_520_cov_36.794055_g5505_i0:169-378(-)
MNIYMMNMINAFYGLNGMHMEEFVLKANLNIKKNIMYYLNIMILEKLNQFINILMVEYQKLYLLMRKIM